MSPATETIEKLAADIGENIYIDVARWHLYLAEAKLHTALATQFYDLLLGSSIQAPAVKAVLEKISVPVGGGQTELPLSQLIPTTGQARLLELLQNWQREL